MSTARALFVYSGLWVALCGFGLALSTYVTTGIAPNYLYCAFCFCSAFFTYSLDRFLTRLSPEDGLNRPGQREWQEAHGGSLRAALVAAGLAGLGLFFFLEPRMYPGLAVFALLALLYVWPGPRTGPTAAARGFLKPFLLTAVWIGGVVWIPLFAERASVGGGLDAADTYLVGVRFALFAANCVLFDVLDYRGDRRFGKTTFAVRHGRRAGLRLAIFCLLVCAALVVSRVVHLGEPAFLRELVPPLVFLLLAANPRRLLFARGRSGFMRALLDGLLLLPLPVHGVYVLMAGQ